MSDLMCPYPRNSLDDSTYYVKEVLSLVNDFPDVQRSLHYDFLLWVKNNHTIGEAQIILDEFITDGIYPESFLEQWRAT